MPQLDAIGIVSADLERTRAFYRVLGIEFGEGDEDRQFVMRTVGTRWATRAAALERAVGRWVA